MKARHPVILAKATHRMWEMSREDKESIATSIQSNKVSFGNQILDSFGYCN